MAYSIDKDEVKVVQGRDSLNKMEHDGTGDMIDTSSTISLKLYVGQYAFYRLLGRNDINRKKVETEIQELCNDTQITIEVNKQLQTITLFAANNCIAKASKVLRSMLSEITEQIAIESREEMIGGESTGVRALLGRGGCVRDILQPDDFRSVIVGQKDKIVELTEECVRNSLDWYGPIESIRIANENEQNCRFWGEVTFVYDVDAQAAVDGISEDEDSKIYLKPKPLDKRMTTHKMRNEYTIKLTWCRRMSKGHCCVELSSPEDLELVSRSINYDGIEIMIKLANNQSSLYMHGLGYDVMEQEIESCLAKLLHTNEKNIKERFHVVIPRRITNLSVNDRLVAQQNFADIVSDLTGISKDKFRVHLKDYSHKTSICHASVSFDEAALYQNVSECLGDSDFQMNCSRVRVNECRSTVTIGKNHYRLVKRDLDDLLRTSERFSASFEEKHLTHGGFRLLVIAPSFFELTRIKVEIDKIVGDTTLECESTDNLHMLFTEAARPMVKRFERKTKTSIYLDERNMKVIIKGSVRGRMKVVNDFNRFLASYDTSVGKTARLNGDVMEALSVKYGEMCEKLIEETGVIKVQFIQREITITGANDAVTKALDIINSIREEMNHEINEQDDFPECPICLCPVYMHDILRLELCGHSYCSVCLISMIQNALFHKELPIKCTNIACDQPLVIRDFNSLIEIGKLKQADLLDAALSCFILSNKNKFRFCITPDCSMIYPVSNWDESKLFICPTCQVQICSTCHLPFHAGSTCAMYKMCPKCNIKIEKDGECQLVHCTTCNWHICWYCMKCFKKSRSCVDHLRMVHG